MKDAKRTQRGSVIGPVIAIIVVLGLVAVAGIQLNRARERLIEENDSLAADLIAAQSRVAELRHELEAEQAARYEGEAAAKAAVEQADREREEAQQRQKTLGERIQELEATLRGYEQQVASVKAATLRAESALTRESELRQALEQELAGVREQLRQRDAAVAQSLPAGGAAPPGVADMRASTQPSRTDAPSASVTEPRPSGSTSAAKQHIGDEGDAREPFDTPPKPVELISPEYPPALKELGTGGEVTVAFTVDTGGRVRGAEVREASNAAFGEAALEAVRRWRFKPALRDGEPVEVRIAQRLTFNSR